MNKHEVIGRMAEITEDTKKNSEKHLLAFLQVLEEALEKGDKVQLVSYLTIEGKQTNKRTGRNPQSGEEIQIPASRKVKFKAGKVLSDAVLKVPIVEE